MMFKEPHSVEGERVAAGRAEFPLNVHYYANLLEVWSQDYGILCRRGYMGHKTFERNLHKKRPHPRKLCSSPDVEPVLPV